MKRVFKVRRVVNGGLVKADAFHAKLAEITKQVSAIRKVTASELARELVSDGFRHMLDMTGAQLAAMARELSPTGLLMLLEGLSSEVRRLNTMAADGPDGLNGPDAIHDYTAGEAGDIVGLSKLGNPGAVSPVDVQAVSNEIAHVLSIVVDEHNKRAREAPHNDGRILSPDQPAQLDPLARSANNAMTLDALSAYADRENAKAAALRRQGTEGALGLSKQARQRDAEIAKARRQRLPNDSYTGSTAPLAARIRRP